VRRSAIRQTNSQPADPLVQAVVEALSIGWCPI
jgi:hypothetical protein